MQFLVLLTMRRCVLSLLKAISPSELAFRSAHCGNDIVTRLLTLL